MKVLKTIGNCCLVFLAIASIIVTLAYGYVHFFISDTTTGTNYIDDQVPIDLMDKVDSLSKEEIDYYENRVLFNVNYYSNGKNNGLQVQEMNLEYFTDYTLTTGSCRATGMQYIGDFKSEVVFFSGSDKEDQINELVPSTFYYYDTTNLVSWSGGKVGTQLNRNFKFNIKIDEKPYLMQLTGSGYVYRDVFGFKVKNPLYYTYASVFEDVLNAVETNSVGYGDYYITLDLSKYFTVYEFDEESGKYKEDNITDEIFTYSVCKFHYDENGMTNSNQSLFSQIECNRNYGQSNTEYWQERFNYSLTDKDFVYRYSDTYKGYLLSLDQKTRIMFNNMPRSKVNINIDLNSSYYVTNKINVVGLDYNSFKDFNIDTLTITGFAQNFYLLENSLFDTNLKTFKHSKDINIIFTDNVINTEYVEVVL